MIWQILICTINCIISIAIISILLTQLHRYEKEHLTEGEETIKIITAYNKELLAKADAYLKSKGLRYWKEHKNSISPIYHINIDFNGTHELCREVCFYLLPGKIINKTIPEAIDKMTSSYELFKEEIEDCIAKYGIYKGE